MELVNLTPHTINPIGGTPIPPSGQVARVSSRLEKVGEINGFPLYRTIYGAVEGLPQPTPGTIYIVSRMVKNLVPQRDDIVVPGRLIRDNDGKVVGCDGFALS